MSKLEQIVCDRCGKPFEYRLSNVACYFRKGIKVRNFFHFRKLFYGNPSGYEYMDHTFELCADCTNKLDEFLKGGADMREETSVCQNPKGNCFTCKLFEVCDAKTKPADMRGEDK